MKRICSYALFVLFLISAFSLSYSKVSAAVDGDLSGWAWSSGIGWISFNCSNTDSIDGSCTKSGYKVHQNSDGTLTGYAWSPTIGWIQFGGFSSGFPTGSGTASVNARISGSNVIGWAKALSADNQGWDGWISLSGTNYGVTSGSTFSGYAWGSDVIGWVSFDVKAYGNPPFQCVSDCDVHVNYSGNVSLSAQDTKNLGTSISGGHIPYNSTALLTWTIDNGLAGISCNLSKTTSGGTSFTTVSNITTTGSTTTSSLVAGAYTFALNCINPTLSQEVSFTVDPENPTFSLGSDEGISIQIVGSQASQSEQNNTFVYTAGGYSSPVDIAISSYPQAPASTTFSYSLDGGLTYSTNPSLSSPKVTISNYSQGVPFKMKIIRNADARDPITDPFIITLRGTGSDSSHLTATKNIIVTPKTFDPSYEER